MLDGIGFASSQSFSADIASRVLNNKWMDLTGNVKNIIILLPIEGHESPSMSEEARLINQPYVPEILKWVEAPISYGLMGMWAMITK